jgi:ribonucleoside-diphosphate reductase alpha chain
MAKAGSTIAGLMESFGTVVSVALQHGVPLQVLVGKLSHTRFEPSGLERQPAAGLCQVHHGLPFPLA